MRNRFHVSWHSVLVSLALVALPTTDAIAQTFTPPLQSIAQLHVQRYLGRWYEIARFPNRFQKQCLSDVSADYAMRSDGQISVLNQCRLANGKWERAWGVVRQVGAEDSARLKVRFAPDWLSFVPWVWGDYWVIDLDASYGLVAVSEPSRQYLWVLSRTPQVDGPRYEALLQRLEAQGLDTQKLRKSNQILPPN
jgi:apolipoprotein D and lipocalin family protein